MILYRPVKQSLLSQTFGLKGTQKNMLPQYKAIGLTAHDGWDWVCPDGEPVYWDGGGRGTVIQQSTDPNVGLGVVIYTDDKDGKMKHIFWHFKEIKCKIGQEVESGDLLGLADSTGFSTGSHLHRGLKMCDENYNTLDHENGYFGAIDIQPYFQNIYIKDLITTLQSQLSVLSQIMGVLKKIFELLKR